jgi:hypothetical protein
MSPMVLDMVTLILPLTPSPKNAMLVIQLTPFVSSGDVARIGNAPRTTIEWFNVKVCVRLPLERHKSLQ